MLVNRKNKGAASVLEVILTQEEVLGKDALSPLLVRDRLVAMGDPSDNKFTIICDGITARHVAIGTFSQDPQKLKEAVDAALEELRDCFRPLPRNIVKMLTS